MPTEKPCYRNYLAAADDIITWTLMMSATPRTQPLPPQLISTTSSLLGILQRQHKDFFDKKIGGLAVAVPTRTAWIEQSVKQIKTELDKLKPTIDGMALADKTGRVQYSTHTGVSPLNPEIMRGQLTALSTSENTGTGRNVGYNPSDPFLGVHSATGGKSRQPIWEAAHAPS